MTYAALQAQVGNYVLIDGWTPSRVASFLEAHVDEFSGPEQASITEQIAVYRTCGDDWLTAHAAFAPRQKSPKKLTMPDPFSDAPQQGIDF